MPEIDPSSRSLPSSAGASGGGDVLADEPNSVEPGRGLAWFSEGWTLFRRAPLIWVALAVVAIIGLLVVGLVPVVGQLIVTLVCVLLAGGFMIGCRALDHGEPLTLAHLFAGFQSHLSPLLVVGALYVAGVFVLVVAVSLVTGGAAFALFQGDIELGAALGSVLLVLLVSGVVILPLAMAVWFAPALSTLNNVPPVEAMKLSFRGCLRNLLAFLVYSVILLVLALVATAPAGLGWLVLIPVLAASVYAAYKDIFLRR